MCVAKVVVALPECAELAAVSVLDQENGSLELPNVCDRERSREILAYASARDGGAPFPVDSVRSFSASFQCDPSVGEI